MELALSIAVGVALSATSGFRVFVPFLVLSAANLAGWLELSDSFAWIGTYPALAVLAVATVVEILAYFIPWVDNALNAISVPASIVAGTILTFAFVGEMEPVLAWSISIVAGGGASLLTRAVTGIIHAGSAAATGGLATPAISLTESIGSFIMSVIALIAPIIAIVLIIFFIYWAVQALRRAKARKGGLT